jgi:hypothetical protein
MAANTSRTEQELADKFELKELTGAAQATEQERTATVASAFKSHKKAVFWSMALSAAYVQPVRIAANTQIDHGRIRCDRCRRFLWSP